MVKELNYPGEDSQISKKCEGCDKYWECYFCHIPTHCRHFCLKRDEAMAESDVCEICQRDWAKCRLCKSNEHCKHFCSDWNDNTTIKVRVCPRCKETWIKCKYCESEEHCLDNCAAFKEKFEKSRLFFQVIGMILYIFEVGSDIILAIEYFSNGHPIWGSLTTMFIVIPGISMSVYSIHKWKIMGRFSCFRALFAAFLISPFAWMIEIIYYWSLLRRAYKSTKCGKKKEYERKLNILTDKLDFTNEVLYRTQIFEAYMENSPQMVLQLYIISTTGFYNITFTTIRQWMSILTSWLSVSWIMVNFYASVHPTVDMPFLTKIFILLPWYIFTIGARVLPMALLASVHRWWLFAFGLIHTFIMYIYRILRIRAHRLGDSYKPAKGISKRRLFLADFIVSLTYIFCFNPKMTFFKVEVQTNTCLHYIMYYILAYMANAVMILLWYTHDEGTHFDLNDISLNYTRHDQNLSNAASIHSNLHPQPEWFRTCALVFVLGGFWVGLSMMIAYYGLFHRRSHMIRKRAKEALTCSITNRDH